MMSGKVSRAALAGWQEILPHRDLSKLSLFEGLNLGCSAEPGSSDGQVELADFVAFLESEADLLKRSDFFWRAGENYRYEQLGDIGLAVLSSKTLGGALRRFASYFSLLQDASEMNFEVADSYATISYRILDPKIWSRNCDANFTLGIVAQLIKGAVSADWRDADVIFEIEAPKWGHDISDYLKVHCNYGGSANMIRMPVSWLSLPISGPARTADVENALKANLAAQQRDANVRDRVQYHIFKNIGVRNFNQNTLAKEMGMSGRTLRRKLAEVKCNFQCLVDECRTGVAALELKRRPCASLTEIAFQLGYTEHSSFTRAFRRWNGRSPQQYRQDLSPRRTASLAAE